MLCSTVAMKYLDARVKLLGFEYYVTVMIVYLKLSYSSCHLTISYTNYFNYKSLWLFNLNKLTYPFFNRFSNDLNGKLLTLTKLYSFS